VALEVCRAELRRLECRGRWFEQTGRQ